jgi:hypothetical protein
MINTSGRSLFWWISGFIFISIHFGIWFSFENSFPFFSEERATVRGIGHAVGAALVGWFCMRTFAILSFDTGTMVLSSLSFWGKHLNKKTIDFDKIEFVHLRGLYANIKMRDDRKPDSFVYTPDTTIYFPHTFYNFDALLSAMKAKNVKIIR